MDNQEKRMVLKAEMSRFTIRKLTQVLDNKYMELIDKGKLDPEVLEKDVADFEFEVEMVIAEIENYRKKVINLMTEKV